MSESTKTKLTTASGHKPSKFLDTTGLGQRHQIISWPLSSFAIGKDFTSSNPTELFIDRATFEFGIIYYDSCSIAAVDQYSDTDEPVYFEAKKARAACWQEQCSKVSILFQDLQIDLKFLIPRHAREFVDALENLAAMTQNKSFCKHAITTKGFSNSYFDMADKGYVERVNQLGMVVPATSSHWAKVRKSCEWSDFTIIAGDRSFPVHRVRLCEESLYFKAACNGGFAESDKCVIKLPESERTVDAMLDEMYDTYNSTTGSLFTGFVLRPEMEKERVLNDLLDLFVATDKYNLEKIKAKVAKAIIDRLPFVHDPLIIVDLASCVFDKSSPHLDQDLRQALIVEIQIRLPMIINDEGAWAEYSSNKTLLKAFHVAYFDRPVLMTAAPDPSSVASKPAGGKKRKCQ